MFLRVLPLLSLLVTVSAYSQQSRRAFCASAATAAVASFAPPSAQALNACPPGSKNCIRTTWTAPAGTSQGDMAKAITQALEAYPQAGQADVDLGGYAIVANDLEGSGTARVEYYSGVGNFAKFFNGGKTFVDDLEITLEGNVAQIRSASRIGDSDFSVNQKRLLFLGSALSSKGWTMPEPKY